MIVDERHELLSSKRGVLLLELYPGRGCAALTSRLQTWGMSATLGNLDEAMRVLIGPVMRHSARRARADSAARSTRKS